MSDTIREALEIIEKHSEPGTMAYIQARRALALLPQSPEGQEGQRHLTIDEQRMMGRVLRASTTLIGTIEPAKVASESPEGMVMVPREPSGEMVKAGLVKLLSIKKRHGIGTASSLEVKAIFQAMIAASSHSQKEDKTP
jgi:hypothetical protein